MIKKDIVEALKEVKNLTCELRLKVNVITKEEFVKITGKIDRQVGKLLEDIEK